MQLHLQRLRPGTFFSVNSAVLPIEKCPTIVSCLVNNASVRFEVDSGAEVSTITSQDAEKCNLSVVPSARRLISYSNHVIHPKGQATATLSYNGLQFSHAFLIVDSHANLLGRDLCKKLNITFSINVNSSSCNSLVSANSSIKREFHAYLSDSFQSNVCDTVSLNIEDNATPVYCKARVVPVRLKNAVMTELNRLESTGRISKVYSSKWASPTVNVLKSDNTVRICGDFSGTLNKFLVPVNSPLPSIDDVIAQVGDSKIFAKLDMSNAFLQLPLDELSKPFTTINTSDGLYMYNYLPFGLSASPGLFQGYMNKLLDNIPNVIAYQDDILVLSPDEATHLDTLRRVLRTLQDAGIKLNTDKSVFFTSSVNYLGYVFDSTGVHPNSDKIRAIIEAPEPSNIKQTQAFLGMCNFYSRFIPNYSDVMQPLYQLLKKEVEFTWNQEQQKCFELIKNMFRERNVLKLYDPNHETLLETDASNYGIAAVLMQREKSTAPWSPVQFASRTLNQAERNYSNIEREGLSVLFGVEKFRKFLLGCRFIIRNDHMPLKKLFAHNKNISTTCSARLQRWALRLSQYSYEFQYSKGTDNVNSDCLSRLPLPDIRSQCEPYEIIFNVNSLEESIVTCENVEIHTNQDPNLVTLKKYIKFGFPSNCNNPELRKFKSSISQMSMMKGCILFKDRVFIPESLRPLVLSAFHSNHPGICAMKTMARALIWYPGLDKDITNLVENCKICQANRSRPAQNNNIQWPTPPRPWSRLHIDHFFYENKTCLIAVDALSKYIEVEIVPNVSVAETIDALRLIFSRNGLCDVVVSDNASCFTADEFKKFLQNNGITHITPPPYSPASNGQAERGVRVIKDLLKKNTSGGSLKTRLAQALIFYRSVPHSITQIAPSVALNGRKFITAKDKINPQYCHVPKSEFTNLKQFVPGDSVLALNLRGGPKWYTGTIVQKLGVNVFQVHIKDLDVVWKRHANQLLSIPTSDKNVPGKMLDRYFSHLWPNALPLEPNASQSQPQSIVAIVEPSPVEPNASQSQPQSIVTNVEPSPVTHTPSSVPLRRSSRVPKPKKMFAFD